MRTPEADILVIDDDAAAVEFLLERLVGLGYRTVGETDAKRGLERAVDGAFDLVITDVEMPGLRGVPLLHALLERRPGQLVIMMTAFGSIDMAVSCVRAGAADFVTKPFRMDTMALAVERALRERQMRREIVRLQKALGHAPDADFVARSPAMQRVTDVASRAATSTFPVLLTGESGTGKSRIARFIHDRGPRKAGPFVTINCAALPGGLVESELFGAKKGAFTDAAADRPGVFVEAHGGTLFLDEVGELPLDVQPKLLHALEAGRVRAVGARGETKVDVRLIAATNRDLEACLRAQTFRPDLYYRLNVIRIDVPPLRERPEDLPLLVDALLARAADRSASAPLGISRDALRLLLTRAWPGNVRELANALERAVALAEHDVLLPEDFPAGPALTPDDDYLLAEARRGTPLDEIEHRYVAKMVEVTNGNISEAARVLGIDRRTLYKKLDAAL